MSFSSRFKSKSGGKSTLDKIIREKALVYALWVNQQNGRKAYFVIEIEPSKHNSFKKHIESKETFDLATYGTIIYSGWNEPDERKKSEFNNKYGLYANKLS